MPTPFIMKGHFFYKGIYTAQHENAGSVFEKLLDQVKPSRILEIGTSYGGLTLILSELTNCTIRSYDISPCNQREHSRVGDMIVADAFDHLDEIRDYIQEKGTTIVLCDGGNKIKEFNTLSEYLKDCDIIMAHDYCPNKEVFERDFKDKIWNWMEISDSDVVQLKPFMSEEFKNVAWLCRMK